MTQIRAFLSLLASTNLSQRAVAEAIGVPKRTLMRRIQAGKLSIPLARKIAESVVDLSRREPIRPWALSAESIEDIRAMRRRGSLWREIAAVEWERRDGKRARFAVCSIRQAAQRTAPRPLYRKVDSFEAMMLGVAE